MKIYQYGTKLLSYILHKYMYNIIYPIPNIFVLCKEVNPQFVHTNATEGRKVPPNCIEFKLSCNVLAK